MVSRFLGEVLSFSNRNFVFLRRHVNKRCLKRYSASLVESQKLKNLVNEAEKLVGYPTFLIRCLLSDEISSVLVHSKKLVGSRHPLVKAARRMVYDGAEGLDAIGLIVLLVSRTGEPLVTQRPPLGQEPVGGVQRNQRKLAEVAEMINTGYMVHLGVMNKTNFQPSDDFNVMNSGNKISVLSGDFLLAKASVGLSELEDSRVVEIMAEVIGDIAEGETLKDYRKINELEWDDWEDIAFKSRGSLFAKSCLAALKLGSLSQLHQDAGFSFGKHLALLQQLHKDYQEITSDAPSTSNTNAAIILAKDTLPQTLFDNVEQSSSIAINESTQTLLKDSDTYIKMQDLCHTYGRKALESLAYFPTSEAKTCLENLVEHFMVLQNVD